MACDRSRLTLSSWARAAALVFLVLGTPRPSSAAPSVRTSGYSAPAEQAFARALDAYRSGAYADAARRLRQLLDRPAHQRTTAAMLLLAHAQYRLGADEDALRIAASLERGFPASRYVPYGRLLAGDVFLRRHRPAEAAERYASVLLSPAQPTLQARAAERLSAMIESQWLTRDELSGIEARLGSRRLGEILLCGRARWFARVGRWTEARLAAAAYRDSVVGGAFGPLLTEESLEALRPESGRPAGSSDRVEAGQAVPAASRPGVLRVGLLLPLSGTEDAVRVGVDLRAGAQLANEEAGSPFELIEADIGADYGDLPVVEAESCRMLRVAEQTRRLAAADDVVAIIGPVYSSDCVVAAVVADGAGVPLIAPLAEQGGLERAGSTLLQLGMPPGVQARALAEYATRDLELVTLAVVSPLTDYGWAFEREFARAAQANGGVVIHADWYVPEVTKDFRRVFGDLRRVAQGLQGSVPGPWLDTRTPPVAPGLTDSLGGSAAPSDAPLPAADGSVDNGDPIAAELPLAGPSGEAYGDTSEVFVDALDGLVIVAESFADAQIIAPQVQYHRLRTQVLGNDVWYEPDLVQQMRPADRAHFEGAVVVTGRSTDDDAGQRFAAAFRRRYRREPGLAAAGHCAARLLVEAWRRGHRTRSAIGEWLAAAATSGDGAAIASCGGRASEPTVLRIDEHGHFRRVGGGGAE